MEKVQCYCAANNIYIEDGEIIVQSMTIGEQFFRWIIIHSIQERLRLADFWRSQTP